MLHAQRLQNLLIGNAAWFSEENLFTDERAINNLARKNRSLFQRIRDWLHGVRVKLRGTAEEKFILKTEKMYTKALDSLEGTKSQALGVLENGQKNNASGETQYSFAEQKIPNYEELVAKPDIPVVDIRGRGEGRIAEQRKQFLNSPEAQKLYEAPVINRDTGELVFITPATLKHIFFNQGFEQINAAKHIDEIIKDAVLTHAEPITHKNENAQMIYTLFGVVQTEQGIQPIKLKVKEYSVGKQRLPQEIQKYFDTNGVQNPYASAYDGRVLELESIEKEEASSFAMPTLAENSAQGDYPSTSSTIRVADLYELVNGEYQKYLPQKGQESTEYSQGSSFTELMRKHGYDEQAYRMERAVKRYGAIPRGELAARDVVLPRQRDDDTHVSRFARTAAESSVLSDEQAGEIGKVVALDAMLKKLQADLDKNKKNRVLLRVPAELRERLVEVKGEEQVNAVVDEIYQSLADQLPVRWTDKWNAWRYLSMLGNPRTHIRNVLENAAFAPVVGTVIESAVQNTQRIAGKEGITRTKTVMGNLPFTGGRAREFAIKDFAEVRDTITGGGKMNPSDIIREKQKIFKSKTLETLRQKNSNWLEREDMWFLKPHYVRAMVQFMQSNKVNMDTFSPETSQQHAALLNRARDYAIKEAQKATYRDFSQAAQAISQMSRNAGNLGNVLIEGVLPFKKTPINHNQDWRSVLHSGLACTSLYAVFCGRRNAACSRRI